MDKIYKACQFPCTENIQLHKYFEQYSSDCKLKYDPDISDMNEREKNNTVLNVMETKMAKKERNIFLNTCSIELLDVDGEKAPVDLPATAKILSVKLEEPYQLTENARLLETIETRGRFESNKDFLIQAQERRREMDSYYVAPEHNNSDKDLEPGSNILVSVRVYHPLPFNYQSKNSNRKLKFSHEIVALGSNTLAFLRDKILCSNDVGLCAEAETPDKDILFGEAKVKYPSGFIFIDNTFYNDNHSQNSIDYSEVILKWAKEKSMTDLKTADMENTRIESLSPRFGYPYVYQHQGDCEHILVFCDCQLLSASDSLSSLDYPYYRYLKRHSSKLCYICGATVSRWICENSNRLPYDRTFLCNECFLSYNYLNKEKIGNFKAYPYFDKSSVM